MREGDTKENCASLSLWEKSLSDLQEEIDPQIYSAYIRPLTLRSFDEERSEFHVAAPSRLVCNHVDKNFGDRISHMLSKKLGVSDVQIRFSVVESAERKPRSLQHVVVKKFRPQELKEEEREQRAAAGRLNSRYLFSNFVVGNNSQFCHAASRQVAEKPGHSYNPLFIYGGVGLGKTHLLHAIGNAVLSQNGRARVVYMSSEMFTNDLIHSLRHAKMEQFKARMRAIEVLLLDDIQFMCGKERTQEEFFHTFNALYNAKHQIVITSDKLPQEIPGIEERLLTRFSWGLTADLQAPDFETRAAILRRKADLDGFELPLEIANWIAERISSNVRELEGALTRLHALSSLQNEDLTVALAEKALRPLIQPKQISVSVEDIKKSVSSHFGIKVSEIVSKRRTRNLSFPRHIAMFLCRKHTTASYPEIGGRFGSRDHSSVIHAANVVASKVASDSGVAELVKKIEERLFGAAR